MQLALLQRRSHEQRYQEQRQYQHEEERVQLQPALQRQQLPPPPPPPQPRWLYPQPPSSLPARVQAYPSQLFEHPHGGQPYEHHQQQKDYSSYMW